jgi:DNA-binding beta-propeller fold protein YncE
MPRALVTAIALAALATAGAQPATADFRFLSEWGSLGTAPGQFDIPDGVAVDPAGRVYVADRENNRIQKFTSSGRLIAVWGRNGGDGSLGLGPGEFNGPYGVAVDGRGDVYVLDSRNNRVQKFSPDGRFLTMWGANGGDGSYGARPGELSDPRGIDADRHGFVYVADHGNHRIQKFSSDGRLLAVWGRNGGDGSAGSGPGEFEQPRGVTTDSAGNVYVAEKLNHRIQKLSPDGRFVTCWGKNGGTGGGDAAIGSAPGEFNLPYDVAVDERDDVYVTDTSNTRVQKFTADGRFLFAWGGPGSGAGQFHDPYGVDTDCRSTVYVTDEGNDRVQRFGRSSAPPPRCPPRLELALPRGGRLARGLALRVECDLPCTVTASGRSGGRLRLGPVTRELPAATSARLVLHLSRSQLAVVRRAPARRLATRVRVRASGFGGGSRTVRTLRARTR